MAGSAVLASLLLTIRQHEGFPELLASVEKPSIRPYRPREAPEIERSRAQWIFESGKKAQDEIWRAFLTGSATSEQENP